MSPRARSRRIEFSLRQSEDKHATASINEDATHYKLNGDACVHGIALIAVFDESQLQRFSLPESRTRVRFKWEHSMKK